MNFKKTLILAAVLCFLMLVFYLIESPLKNNKKQEYPLLFAEFDKGKAASVFLKTSGKGEFRLKKKPGGWVVEAQGKSYSADSASIDTLLDTLGKIRIEAVVSKNPNKYSVFEADSGKGTEVKIADASQNSVAHFYVGKSGPDLFSTYLRMEKSTEVVLSSGILKTVFDRDLKDWRNKTIFSLKQGDVIEYQVKGDAPLHFKKADSGTWEVIEPAKSPARKETVDDCLKTFCSLKTADFAEGQLQDMQLDKPVKEITATLKGGTTKTLLVGKDKNAFQKFVKAQDAETIFVLENYNMEKLSPSIDTFGQAAKGKDKGTQTPKEQNKAKQEKKQKAKAKSSSQPSPRKKPARK
ncbi:MAG: DUF4340 domain-containing protein [Proteobacteria bacterium]|nr:DUF4340 domain-containing protein [Pseudomonadota bacterium]